jgi:phi13 family phage major tail protein
MADKVKYGVRKVHYALMTTMGTYSTPVAMPGAVSLSLSPSGELSPFYADDIRYFVAMANNGYDVDLELAYVPESFLTDIMGMVQDSTAKVIYEKSDVQPKPFALLFEEEGDVSGTKFVLYNCTANRPNHNLATKEDAINPQTQSLTIYASPLDSGEVFAETKSDTTTTVLNGWYSSVWKHA